MCVFLLLHEGRWPLFLLLLHGLHALMGPFSMEGNRRSLHWVLMCGAGAWTACCKSSGLLPLPVLASAVQCSRGHAAVFVAVGAHMHPFVDSICVGEQG